MKTLKAILLIAIFATSTIVFALPQPQGYVSDFAGLLDSESRVKLTQALESIEKSTGIEIAVITQPSLPGDTTIEEQAITYLSEWRIGKKGKDNGLVLLIVDDRERDYRAYRFETGLGLEGDLPDGLLGQIGREEMVPFFRSGRYGDGILSAIVRIGGILGADLNVEAPGKKKQGLPGLGALIFIIVILFLIFSRGGRGGRRGGGLGSDLFWLMLLGGMSGRRGGGFGGGGFGSGGFGGGGGGFGGFGGGGGGAGGGATGRW